MCAYRRMCTHSFPVVLCRAKSHYHSTGLSFWATKPSVCSLNSLPRIHQGTVKMLEVLMKQAVHTLCLPAQVNSVSKQVKVPLLMLRHKLDHSFLTKGPGSRPSVEPISAVPPTSLASLCGCVSRSPLTALVYWCADPTETVSVLTQLH